MSAQLGRERSRSLKSAVLSGSFERKMRAETLNAQENARLEKQQRDIDLFKNNTEKIHMAEKNKVQSRMQSLRKIVLSRTQSSESTSSSTVSSKMDVECVRFPRLPNSTDTNGKLSIETCTENYRSAPELHLVCEENGKVATHLPSIKDAISAGARAKRRTLVTVDNESLNIIADRRRSRTQSHSVVEDLKLPSNRVALKSTVQDCYGTPLASRRDLIAVNSFQPKELSNLNSRRRSLSTGDMTLTERVNSFLESIETSPLVGQSRGSFSSSCSDDENDAI